MTQTIEQLTDRVRELTAENRIERNLRSGVEAAFDMLNEEIGRYKAAFEQQKAEVGRLSIAHVKACQVNADSQAELAAAQEETRLLTERNATNEEYAANLVKALTKTQDQLAKANQLWQAAQGRCDGLEEKLAKAEQRVVRQYYSKNNSCKAESAHDPDCICWHDEGTGPRQPLPDGTYPVQMTWRKFVKEV